MGARCNQEPPGVVCPWTCHVAMIRLQWCGKRLYYYYSPCSANIRSIDQISHFLCPGRPFWNFPSAFLSTRPRRSSLVDKKLRICMNGGENSGPAEQKIFFVNWFAIINWFSLNAILWWWGPDVLFMEYGKRISNITLMHSLANINCRPPMGIFMNNWLKKSEQSALLIELRIKPQNNCENGQSVRSHKSMIYMN